MLFENPLHHHLEQVLGYRYVPKSLRTTQNIQTEPLQKVALHLVTNEPASPELDQLLNKMTEAIGCHDYRVLTPQSELEALAQASVIFIFGESLLSEEAKEELAKKARLLESQPLSLIISGTNPQTVIEIKQQIWQDLKKAQFFLSQIRSKAK